CARGYYPAWFAYW
nr:immunoglobulin heavy chain junction region [Mus musculus]MBK4198499.1 immunoglobulin heavy chain junction region [Mus musculus]MBK4198500.1 immunoglobulin heavy chain junction region [Mus musculus]